jgi:hypothetical protein
MEAAEVAYVFVGSFIIMGSLTVLTMLKCMLLEMPLGAGELFSCWWPGSLPPPTLPLTSQNTSALLTA